MPENLGTPAGTASRNVTETGRRPSANRATNCFSSSLQSPICAPLKKVNSKSSILDSPEAAMLEAASNRGFYMFFLALGGLRPYSARRAWHRRFEACRHIRSLNSEEEKETRWQNH